MHFYGIIFVPGLVENPSHIQESLGNRLIGFQQPEPWGPVAPINGPHEHELHSIPHEHVEHHANATNLQSYSNLCGLLRII